MSPCGAAAADPGGDEARRTATPAPKPAACSPETARGAQGLHGTSALDARWFDSRAGLHQMSAGSAETDLLL